VDRSNGAEGDQIHKQAQVIVAAATTVFPRVECFVSASGLGASIGRTLILSRCLTAPRNAARISEIAAEWAILGGVSGIALVLGAGLLGLRSLPDWTEIPAVVVATQAGFSLLMGQMMNRRFGALDREPAGPTYEQVAFALFGAITLPGTLLFIVTMTLVSAL
jgi:hypothetical protein